MDSSRSNKQFLYDFTVVTPSYNQGAYLEKTIRSVLEQEEVSVQYIVVDNCSDDGSSEILEKYEQQLAALIIEPDDGQADAIRKGFKRAEGKFCCYLNSDDYFLPNALYKVKGYFDSLPETDVLYSHRVFIDEEGQLKRYWILPPHNNYLMSRWDYIPQECAFWRTQLMKEAGGIDTNFKFAMDYDFFVRLMSKGYKFKKCNDFFAVFRAHADSKTTKLVHTVGKQEMAKVMDRYGVKTGLLDIVWAAILYGYIACISFAYKIFGKRPAGI